MLQLAFKSCPSSGVGNILAWKPSADDIDSFKIVDSALSNVSFSVDVWPMFCEDPVCIVINLHLPFAHHAGPLETKIKTADTSEQ